MSSIKKLAGQTVWYGISSIFARFLNYLLTPYLTLKFAGTPEYGKMSLIYSAIPLFAILVLFALDTAYFRYVQKREEKEVYDTLLTSLIGSTLLVSVPLILLRQPLANFIHLGAHSEYIIYAVIIIALDALTSLPFAKLRYANRPRKFAFIRVTSILVNIALTYFFLSICPRMVKTHPYSSFWHLYNPNYFLGYILIAGMVQNAFQTVALFPELSAFGWTFNKELWKEVMAYALPLTIAGFGGMINETFDRVMLARRLPLTPDQADYQLGIYSACYKLSLLISLFVQAFRMGAEPFFFRQSVDEDAPRTYARVMKFFVITITLMFLFVALFLDVWKEFIKDKSMWVGLKVVPILLFANMFLGVYYNLSIWYRLSKKTIMGAYITLIGVVITLTINYLFIPRFSYMASAWATFFCYGSMMVISFQWGQKVYPVPYAWKKLVAYMVIVALLYFIHHFSIRVWPNTMFSLALGTLLTGAYAFFILRVERKEFRRLPVIGRFLA